MVRAHTVVMSLPGITPALVKALPVAYASVTRPRLHCVQFTITTPLSEASFNAVNKSVLVHKEKKEKEKIHQFPFQTRVRTKVAGIP